MWPRNRRRWIGDEPEWIRQFAADAKLGAMSELNDEQRKSERGRAGLCADCAHARRIESDRGSVFYLCGLSARDDAYPKYPRLPVTRCAGHAVEKSSA